MSQHSSRKSIARKPNSCRFKLNRLNAALVAGALLGFGTTGAIAEIGTYTQQQRAIEAYKIRTDAARVS